MRSRNTGRWAVLAAAAVVLAGTAWAGKGGSGGTPISTQGVVAFGVAVTDSTRGTYAMNPDGSGLNKLTTQIYAMDISRGRVPVTVLVHGAAAFTDVYAMRADGTGSPALLVSGSAGDARFSLDGERIAYRSVVVVSPPGAQPVVTVWSIYTADVVRDGTGDVTGIANVSTVWTGPRPVTGLDFSRDGTRIVCALDTNPGFDLFVLHLGDGTLEQVTNTPEIETRPRWSPQDDRIAFLRLAVAGSNVNSLLTIDYVTRTTKTILAGGSSQYASNGGAGLCWSPGATNLLTLVGGRNKPLDLYQFPAAGGSGVNVTGGINLSPLAPCWGW